MVFSGPKSLRSSGFFGSAGFRVFVMGSGCQAFLVISWYRPGVNRLGIGVPILEHLRENRNGSYLLTAAPTFCASAIGTLRFIVRLLFSSVCDLCLNPELRTSTPS